MTTNYSYDSLNRVTRKTYSDGVTPEVDFVYDQAVAPVSPPAALANTNGRLAYAFSPGSVMDIYSYDPMGRTTDMWQCVTAPCTSPWHAQHSYDFGGDLLSVGYNGGATLNYSYDSTQRITNVSAPPPNLSGLLPTLFSPTSGQTQYGPVGLLNATLGNGVPEYRSYTNRAWLYSMGTSGAGAQLEAGRGSVTVSGSEQGPANACPNQYPYNCWVYDSGSFSVSVNGAQAGTVNYGQGDTCATVAAGLAASINSSSSIVAAEVSECTVLLIASAEGSATNYALSVSAPTYYSGLFSQPSFTGTASGSTLAGGSDQANATGAYNFTLTYAGNGDVLSAIDAVNGNWAYTYDAFNRLATAQTPPSNPTLGYSYGYDRFGNRWSQAVTAGSGYQMPLSFNANNQISTSGFQYDAAGNVLMDYQNCYSSDAENRLSSVVPLASLGVCGATIDPNNPNADPNAMSYLYDPEGRRVARLHRGQIVKENYYDAAGHMITETDGSGNWLRAEIYAGGRHLATWNPAGGGSTYFNHVDWLGTERARTNSSGTLCWSQSSLPFGDGVTTTNNNCTPTPTFFTGKERDNESNLDYFGARYGSSNVGRFMSPDWSAAPAPVPYAKLGNPQSLNLYSYVLNNPATGTDPDGHWCLFGKIGTTCVQPPPPPPPPPPISANQRALTEFMSPVRPSRRQETVYQVGGIVNAEAGGMKDSKSENKPLAKAREEIAEVRINGDQKWGDEVGKYAGMAPPKYTGADFQSSLDAAANAAYSSLKGTGVTGGATNYRMWEKMSDALPQWRLDVYTSDGPYVSTTSYKVITTYGPNID